MEIKPVWRVFNTAPQMLMQFFFQFQRKHIISEVAKTFSSVTSVTDAAAPQ